jgi:DNA-binding PadR family transcriptional regulator
MSLLFRQARHGYELHERFETTLGNRRPLNPGQMYATLERLEHDGLVTHQAVAQVTGPDRKVYTLTPQGERALHLWLTSAVERADLLRAELYVKLLMGLLTEAAPFEQIVSAQRQGLLRTLHRLTLERAACDWHTDVPTILMLDSAIMHLHADLEWLSLYEERAADLRAHVWPAQQPRPRGRPPKATMERNDEEGPE